MKKIIKQYTELKDYCNNFGDIMNKIIDFTENNEKVINDNSAIQDVKLMLDNCYEGKFNFDISEAAKILNISIQFIYKEIKRGTIKSVKMGGRILIPRAEIIHILIYGV